MLDAVGHPVRRARAPPVRPAAPRHPPGRDARATSLRWNSAQLLTLSRAAGRPGRRRRDDRRRVDRRESSARASARVHRPGAHRRRRPARREHRARAARRGRRRDPRRRLAAQPAPRHRLRRRPRARATDDAPALIVVAVPPDVDRRRRRARARRAIPDALVTDVASVKLEPLRRAARRAAPTSRATSARTRWPGASAAGAISARADLFVGRPWVVCRARRDHATGDVALVEDLALDLGAMPVEMTPEEHDAASRSSRTCRSWSRRCSPAGSPTPRDAALRPRRARACATRPASRRATPSCGCRSSARTPPPVVDVLARYRDDLDAVIDALDDPDGARLAPRASPRPSPAATTASRACPASTARTSRFAHARRDGRRHARASSARLLTEIGELGVNIEDLRLEHSPGAQFGLAEIAVLPEAAHALVDGARGARLEDRGGSNE